VRVRVGAAGICLSDHHIMEGTGAMPRPVVLGHEGAGVVETVGAGITDLAEGDHVVMSFTSCGQCPSCLDAEPAYCYATDHFACARPDGSYYLQSAGGPVHGDFFNQSSFATHAVAKRRGLVKVPKDAPLEILGPLGCGIQTGAGTVLNVFGIRPGQSLAVFGAGSLGLSAVMAAKAAGAGPIVAVDVHANRLQLAAEMGADEVVDAGAGEDAVRARILAVLPDGADFTMDTSTLAPVMNLAIGLLAPRGTFAFVAPPEDGGTLTVQMRPLMMGRRIVGITEGNSNPESFIPKLIDLHARGKFPYDRLIRFYPFGEIARAFHDSETGAAVKPVLRMD
jgi:aryl-alcohol dehydrogenase